MMRLLSRIVKKRMPGNTLDQDSGSWSGDIWGGVTAMLVALPSSVAFGVLTCSALGADYKGQGAMLGLMGAVALGLVAPLFGGTAGLISAPCAPAAAVLSGMALQLSGKTAIPSMTPSLILTLLALTVLLAAVLQIVYGIVGGGRLIKFIPYPVVSGYLSGVAVLITLGQLPKLFGFPKGTPLVTGLTTPALWQWQSVNVGLVTIAIMVFAPRIIKRVPAPIVGLFGGLITYFGLALFFPQMLTLENNPLVIGRIGVSGSLFHGIVQRFASLSSLDVGTLKLVVIPALTLSVLLSIDTLKTCVVLDVLTCRRHNSDQELIGQGFGNLAAFMLGGMPGSGTMGPTLLNVTCGGHSVRSGIVQGVCVLLVTLVLSSMMAWVPIGALAGMLLMVAWRMFDKSMFRLLRNASGRLDFAVIVVVVSVAVGIDLIAAAGAGVALAILLFIRDQIRGSVIRRKSYLNQISSKTRRLSAEREILKQYGDQCVFCELQGNLFFGTADQLFSQLESDLRTKRYVLLDMRRVQSMDYTAAHLFEQMHEQLSKRGGSLILSGMPSALIQHRNFEEYLAQLGAVRKVDLQQTGIGLTGAIMISETLDGALEWMEKRILRRYGAPRRDEDQLIELKDVDLFRGCDETILQGLKACIREISLVKGHNIFACGEKASELFIVRQGSVRILLPLEGGQCHHLATIGPGDFFGEISFLDGNVRTADAQTTAHTQLYAISRAQLDEQVALNPAFGVQFFSRLARAISERLRQADEDLKVIEER